MKKPIAPLFLLLFLAALLPVRAAAVELPLGKLEGNPEGMALYASCSFQYGGRDWAVESYVPADMLLDGELLLDDGCRFLLRVVCLSKLALPEGVVLLDERVQLGVPAADVWVDEQEQLHVTLRDVRTACYQVTDYVYRPERHAMVGSTVLNASGINYVGTTQR